MNCSQAEDVTHHVYVADFGLGKAITSTQAAATATMTAGTPAFQAPEQLKGSSIGASCDMYAFGCVLTELFGERPVWLGTPFHTIMYKVAIEGVFPSYAHVPSLIQSIIMHCLCGEGERKNAHHILKLLC